MALGTVVPGLVASIPPELIRIAYASCPKPTHALFSFELNNESEVD